MSDVSADMNPALARLIEAGEPRSGAELAVSQAQAKLIQGVPCTVSGCTFPGSSVVFVLTARGIASSRFCATHNTGDGEEALAQQVMAVFDVEAARTVAATADEVLDGFTDLVDGLVDASGAELSQQRRSS